MSEEFKSFTPKEIVSALDRYIIGQGEAKKAVAIALRNRWRRQKLDEELQEEILPKNILMIGPTGVGKTEIARRLSKLAQAPFIKVEATKFTEVGYVGRDVESIIRDLVEIAIHMTRERMREEVKDKAHQAAEERILDALVGPGASSGTRENFRERLHKGELDDREVELAVQDQSSPFPLFDVPGMPGASMGMMNVSDMLQKAMGASKTKNKTMKVGDSYDILIQEESDQLLDEDKITTEALRLVEQNGIVFLDEVDKITARSDARGGDISREGVQRDLLPLIEGTTISTKYGAIRTDFILFIASGAFHYAKPSDMLAELQGRLPIRVEMKNLTEEDFQRILTEPEASLIKQYKALMETESVTLEFEQEAIDAMASLAAQINQSVENIGARRLHTVMEKLLEDLSFEASEKQGESVMITAKMVRERLAPLTESGDLSKFIL